MIEHRKFRVLMLVPNLQIANGVASFAINYFRNLNHQKVHMDFALYGDCSSPYYAEVKRAGGRIFILPGINNIAEHIRMCEAILKKGNYDIIHNNTLHITIPMMLCAACHCVPVRILHSHNSKLGNTRRKEIRNAAFLPLLRFLATDYLACSSLAGENLFGKRSFIIVPNVIPTKRFCFMEKKRSVVRRQMRAESKIVVGTVARLAAEKNPFFAMDVFQAFLERKSNAEYWWIGNGPLSEDVKKYIYRKGLERSVRLFGSRNDVADLYQAMDVLFMPSIFEGLPVTGIEAQAMGLPMVVSDTVTNEMCYTDLVDYVNLDATHEVWAEHLSVAAARMGEREQYVGYLKNSCFSDEGCGERLTEIYKKLLEKNMRSRD